MTAPKGYYRNLISDSNIRIAFTHTPVYGCTVVDSSKVMNELEQSQDEHAPYYLDGLKRGLMITIVENQNSNGYLRPGELYFKS